MAFSPKPGCPMCGIVASAVHTPVHSPNSSPLPASSEVLYRDDNFTVYRERANPVSSKGHLVIVFNLHVPSLYDLSSSDLPLLVTVRDLGRRLLDSLLNPSDSAPNTPVTANPTRPLTVDTHLHATLDDKLFRIGFITSPFRDNKIPVTDHLHAHAYILPADLMGWWRSVGYSGLAWYAVDDLIAEIREETSNNRVRSGPKPKRAPRPIDQVPSAGARHGLPNGVETTGAGLGVVDLEDPELSPGTMRPTSFSEFSSLRSPGSSRGVARASLPVAASPY